MKENVCKVQKNKAGVKQIIKRKERGKLKQSIMHRIKNQSAT